MKNLPLGMKIALVTSLALSLVVAVIASALISLPADWVERIGKPLTYTLLIGVTTMATSFICITVSNYFFDQPLEKLIRLISSAASQNFLVRAPIKSHDIIGRLSESFNHLLEHITTLDAFKLDTERELSLAQQKLGLHQEIESKNQTIEKKNEELKARLSELSLIHDITQELSIALEMDELLLSIEKILEEKLKFNQYIFQLYEEESGTLVTKMAKGFPASFTSENASTSIQESQGSFLSLPLIFGKKTAGMLNLHREGTERFSPEEIRFLNTLSVELGIALSNAKLYSKTKALSIRDELTGLYNRRYFQESFANEIKRSQRFIKPLTLLIMDLDHFKTINDRFGHLVGDDILKQCADVISKNVREVDVLARFGGEEFVLILPNTSKEDGIRVANKINQIVSQTKFGPESFTSPLTISIGVSGYSEDGATVDSLLEAADRALYEAKRAGRNKVVMANTVHQEDVIPIVRNRGEAL